MSTNPVDAPPVDDPSAKTAQPNVVPPYAHIFCIWPFIILSPFGGVIGGGLGGAAYGINLGIYQSKLSTPRKVVLNIATGLAAFGILLAIDAVFGLRRR